MKKLSTGFEFFRCFLLPTGLFLMIVGLNEMAQAMDVSPQIKVILAQKWDKKQAVSGWWMSEKFDGVRGYWTGTKMISRSGNAFNLPAWYVKNFPHTALDGELWLGRKKFEDLLSIIKQNDAGMAWQKVHYMIIDAPEKKDIFEKRLQFARQWFHTHPNPYVKVIKQEICQGKAHVLNRLAEVEALGGEGLILRRPHSLYTPGPSRDFLKVKSFDDMKAKVIGHLPGKGRNQGRLGSLLVELPNGTQFKIGSGFTDRIRENPPPIGSIITFKYAGFTKSGIPRFASFVRIWENM